MIQKESFAARRRNAKVAVNKAIRENKSVFTRISDKKRQFKKTIPYSNVSARSPFDQPP